LLSPIEWVKEERRRQDEKWGNQNHNALRWLAILGEEFGEVAKELEDISYVNSPNKAEHTRRLTYELIQVAAVAVSWVEAIRRKKGAECLPTCVCDPCKKRIEDLL